MAFSVKNYIPNTITCLNLLSGCVAVFFAFHISEPFGPLTGLHCCWISIAAAALFDFCDGASARLLKAFSPLGKDLDSLSDLVSFGVAPAMMLLNIMHTKAAPENAWLAYSALLLAPFGALRLAKFNNDTRQTTSFRGLPIPANAIFWIGAAAWIERYSYPGTAVCVLLVLAMCAAMVGNFPMYSLKFKNFELRENFSRYVLILGSAFFVVIYGVSGLMWSILLYFVISFARRRHIE
ncbi:MAG: CDP-alcohol phosphatidyltransferase family protein [Muribaculaceae bacterium]|nr:CDP-alcohol phosphatidyltransferase family protein [Muribaculaceae bacterium]